MLMMMKKMLMKEIIMKDDEHDNNINLDEVEYDNKKIIILAYITCIITFKCNQFECG